jgi:hypothetical protein
MTSVVATLRARASIACAEVVAAPWARAVAGGELRAEGWAAWLDLDVELARDWLETLSVALRLAPTPAARDGWAGLGRLVRGELEALQRRLSVTLGLAFEDLGAGQHTDPDVRPGLRSLGEVLLQSGPDYAPTVAALYPRHLLHHEVAKALSARRPKDARAADWLRTLSDPGLGRALRWMETELATATAHPLGPSVAPAGRTRRLEEVFEAALHLSAVALKRA